MPLSQTEIVITRDGAKIASRLFGLGKYTIGRDLDCALRIDDPGISPKHARLTLDAEGAMIEDLGSQQGTYVNGKQVTVATRLRSSEQVRVGASTLIGLQPRESESSADDSDAPTMMPSEEARQYSTAGRSGLPSYLPREFLRDKKYDVGAVVAKGGMGAILSAREATTERTVAMKVMLAEGDPAHMLRFILEAKITAQLEHPNIVPVHELGVGEDKRVFYTMKFVGGLTLRKILRLLADGDAETLRKYPLANLLTVFQKLCDAVAFAHSKNVIHRDLKPENVMVGDFGEVLLMDWGLAKVLGEEEEVTIMRQGPKTEDSIDPQASHRPPEGHDPRASKTMVGMVLGTPSYMSPEQARGEVESLDFRTDIYALGGILYHMLALRTAIEGKNANTVVDKVSRGEIDPLPENGPGRKQHLPGGRIPHSLIAVVRKAMALDRDARYSTVAELQAEITAYQSGFATQAEEASLLKKVGLLIQRHKMEFAIGFGAWLVIMAMTAWFMIDLRASERTARRNAELARASEANAIRDKEIARRALAKAQIANADADFRSADPPAMAQALESCPPDLRDQTWDYLWAKRDASVGTVKVAGFETPASIAAVPGRPRLFALAAAGGQIGLVDAADGRLVRSIKTDRTEVNHIGFSGDGRQFILTRAKSSDVDLYDLTSGERLKTFPSSGGEIRFATLSQDGGLLALIAATPTQMVELMLIDTRDGHIKMKRNGHFTSVLISPDGTRLLVGGTSVARVFTILNADDGREISKTTVNAGCQALSPDGKVVAVGSPVGEVLLLDSATGAEMQRARLYNGAVNSVAWTADGHLVTLGTEGRFHNARWLLRLWGPDLNAPEATYFGFRSALLWSFDPASGYLMSEESPARIWRVPAGRELVKIEHGSEQGMSVSFLADNILLARNSYSLTRYDLSTRGRATSLPGALPERFTYGISHWASRLFAINSRLNDKRFFGFKIYSNQGSTAIEKLSKTLHDAIFELAFDADAERIVAVYRNGGLEVFSVQTGDSQLKVDGRFEHAAFVGAGKSLVALALEARPADEIEDTLVTLDGVTGQKTASVMLHFRVSALAVSPDRKLVAIAGSDQAVHLFDAETLHERSFFRAHDGNIGALAFHPLFPILATAAADATVKLWDYNSAELLDYFVGLGGVPLTVAFNPNGRLLAVDGQERISQVYDVSEVRVRDGAKRNLPAVSDQVWQPIEKGSAGKPVAP